MSTPWMLCALLRGLALASRTKAAFPLGRDLWSLFARSIDAVPDATVPVASVALIAVAAVLFANLVAALPGRRAARTPAALVLRAQ